MTFNLHCNLLLAPTTTSSEKTFVSKYSIFLKNTFLLIHGTRLQYNLLKIIIAYLGVDPQLV